MDALFVNNNLELLIAAVLFLIAAPSMCRAIRLSTGQEK